VTVGVRDTGDASIVIRDVAVFSPENLRSEAHQDVLISGNRIQRVTPTGQLKLSDDTYIIEGLGKTLLPGLIDMHGHITTTTGPSWEFALPDPEATLRSYVYAGVTTIFDPSDSSDEAYQRRQQVADGEILGPRVYTTGRIITHPQGHPRALIDQLAPWWIRWYLRPKVGSGVASEEEAIAEVDERADAGADAIKIVVDKIPLDAPTLQQDLTRIVVEHARKRGLRTVAHIGTTEDAIAAAKAGVALWVHGVYKESIPDDKVAELVNFGIPMVTTSEVFDRYGRAAEGPIQTTRLENEIVAADVLESFFPIPDDFDAGPLISWLELMRQTRDTRRDNVRRLHAAGMTILAGSDVQSGVFPGASLHRELGNLVAAGLTPAEAIRAATLAPARFLTGSKKPGFGSISAGKRADLLLVNGDPTLDINTLADIQEVILNGRLLNRQAVEN
jgi:imidazolonepropionase-like amidohydrolase